VPTFPDSVVPRAKRIVTSVQQLLFAMPFSVSPPPDPWGVQFVGGATEDAAGAGAELLAYLLGRIDDGAAFDGDALGTGTTLDGDALGSGAIFDGEALGMGDGFAEVE
jgi:hypothetical protein